ncbi:putative 3-dehydroquinate synthase [Helianthus annuus]|nr:putative 3-dehydroquinate synthase [Helianthus annuus]
MVIASSNSPFGGILQETDSGFVPTPPTITIVHLPPAHIDTFIKMKDDPGGNWGDNKGGTNHKGFVTPLYLLPSIGNSHLGQVNFDCGSLVSDAPFSRQQKTPHFGFGDVSEPQGVFIHVASPNFDSNYSEHHLHRDVAMFNLVCEAIFCSPTFQSASTTFDMTRSKETNHHAQDDSGSYNYVMLTFQINDTRIGWNDEADLYSGVTKGISILHAHPIAIPYQRIYVTSFVLQFPTPCKDTIIQCTAICGLSHTIFAATRVLSKRLSPTPANHPFVVSQHKKLGWLSLGSLVIHSFSWNPGIFNQLARIFMSELTDAIKSFHLFGSVFEFGVMGHEKATRQKKKKNNHGIISVYGVSELAYENTNQAYVANQNHRNLFSYYAYILKIDADSNRESISGTGPLCSITTALASNNSPSQQERNIYSPQETELETKIFQLQTENHYWLQKEVCYEETRIPVEADTVHLTPPSVAVENVILAGDMCGYTATSFLRTVVCIHIPAPVMAQDDSSVGGKIGINQRLENNLIGAFYQPNCVLKETLPGRDVSSGLDEVIKHALINDAFYFEWQDTAMQALLSRIPNTSPYAIKHMCADKDGVVFQTEKLNGLGAPLNLGHSK